MLRWRGGLVISLIFKFKLLLDRDSESNKERKYEIRLKSDYKKVPSMNIVFVVTE